MYNKHKIIKLPGCFSGSMHSGDWPQIIEDSGNIRGSCYRQVKKKKKKTPLKGMQKGKVAGVGR